MVLHQARQRHRGLLHRRQRVRLRGGGRREDATPAKGDTRTRKRPGTTKYQDITLKRTLSPDKKFWNWAKSIRDGTLEYRTNGSLVISDMSGKELSRWTFNNVWPSKWSASDLDVGCDDLMTEEVTLAVEELIRNK